MPRGNAENLRSAALRKHQAVIARATTALEALERDGRPVTFGGLAKAAAVHGENLELRRQLGRQRRPPAA